MNNMKMNSTFSIVCAGWLTAAGALVAAPGQAADCAAPIVVRDATGLPLPGAAVAIEPGTLALTTDDAGRACAVALVQVNLTGLFVLRGKHGLGSRGRWLVAAGALPPILALVAFRLG
jgi:hypothetical protein